MSVASPVKKTIAAPAARPCPLCDAATRPRAAWMPSQYGPLHKCRACSMIYLDAPTPETEWDEEPGYLTNFLAQRERLLASQIGMTREVVERVAPCGPRVLEIGLGVGAVAQAARDRGLEYWCVEPFKPLVELAIREGQVAAERTFATTVENASLPRGFFDSIVMVMVLEHLWRPTEVLQACWNALRPGGAIYVEVPNSRFFRGRTQLRRLFGMTDFMAGHVNFYTPETLARSLRDAGFERPETRIVSNAQRGDADMTVSYYKKSGWKLRALFGTLKRFPVDRWLGVAPVLAAQATRPSGAA